MNGSRSGFSVSSLMCMIAAVALAISAVLPCQVWSFPGLGSVSRAMVDGSEGGFVIGIGVVAALCSAVAMIAGLRKLNLVSLAVGAVGVVVFVMENIGVEQKLKSIAGDYDWLAGVLTIGNKLLKSNGAGYYVLLVAALALIVFSVLGIFEKK